MHKVFRGVLRKIGLGVRTRSPKTAAFETERVSEHAHAHLRNTFAFGSAVDGRLGTLASLDSPTHRTDSPTHRIEFFGDTGLAGLAAGGAHSVFVREGDGAAFGCGSNFYGQTGVSAVVDDYDDDVDAVEVPTRVGVVAADKPAADKPRFAQAACGAFHSAAVADDGSLWTWGAACLGRRDELYDANALKVPFFADARRRVVCVKAQGDLTLVHAKPLDSEKDDEVYVWGYFTAGNKIHKSTVPILVSHALSLSSVNAIAVSLSTFAVLGSCNSSNSNDSSHPRCRVDLFGFFDSLTAFDQPMFPTYLEMDSVDRVYSFSPVASFFCDLFLAEDVVDFVVFRGEFLDCTPKA
ncbi:regulator of chromosome condensation 1/beta-lactamase-inhibitor protein II [Obelidium mucronatum]|nr:regulator of chromosome condensation 1/beta-lactamase-inhibitor protein II [Obelidium mucronatum]